MQWHTQVGTITTNIKVKNCFTLLEPRVTKISTKTFHVDDTANGRYKIILGRDQLPDSGLNLKPYDHVIEEGDGPFKESTTPVVDIGTY